VRSSGSAYLSNRQLISGLWRESALGAGIVQSAKAQEHRQRVLDHLGVALADLPDVLITGSPDQLLVQRQIDLARSHRPQDTAAGLPRIADEARRPPDTWSESDKSFLRRLGYVPLEETRNNPIPFLILAAVVGLLLGSWWIGLLVGVGMTIIPAWHCSRCSSTIS
jgi:hypothetical protein